MQNTISERLKMILDYYKENPNSFAKSINVSDVTIRNVLSKRNKPGYDLIVKICEKYNEINPEWFIFGKDEMLSDNPLTKGSDMNSEFDKEKIEYYKNQILEYRQIISELNHIISELRGNLKVTQKNYPDTKPG